MDDPRSAPAQIPRVPMNSQGPDPLIGRVINDRYRVVGTIARGGMGKVYRAEQQPLGRLVALKVLNPNYTGENDPEFHKRFFLEASIASKLTHPNTVTIFDYGKTDDDIYYIAMELLEGRTLHRALREESPLSAERTMHIGRQICRSLREAHNLGVIHRDLKPANVYLVQHGDERDFVKVLDFGLVKNLEDKGEELTQAGLFMGSPKYMAPEQIRGERCDGRCDVYGLGVMMFEMLTGKVPFDRQNSVNILMAHIQEDVPAMSVMNPSARVPAALEAVVRRCMAKSVDARYASMEDVLIALKEVAGLNTTMSGEVRMSDLADLSRSVELPLPPPVQVRGELLSGGKPSITMVDSSGFKTIIASTTPANGQGMEAARVNTRAADRRSKLMLLAAGASLALLAVGGFVAVNGRSHAANTAAVHNPPPSSSAPVGGHTQRPLAPNPSPNAATQPAALPTAVQAQPTVLVSLRSTPPGAMVAVDDKEYGPTPTQVEWTGEEAALGREVTFRFQRKGFRDLTVTRQIRGDKLDIEAPAMDPVVITEPVPTGRRSAAVPSAAPEKQPPAAKGLNSEPY
jgi:serine/threonine-protein kinase